MPLSPLSTGLMMAGNAITSATGWVQGLFTTPTPFSPEESLLNAPGIDPRLKLRVPMSAEGIDVDTLAKLGRMGLKRGKLITAQSHPELYQAWEAMAQRAGLAQTPQLILAESKQINAFSVSPEEAVVTTGILKFLGLRETIAILGHEMAHTVSNHTTPRLIATGLFGITGAFLGNGLAHRGGFGALLDHTKPNPGFFKRAVTWLFGKGGSPESLLGSLAYIMMGIGTGSIVANQVAIRPTELDADRKGVMISGDPEAMISALTKLDQHERRMPAPLRWLAYLAAGYPSIKTRIARIREVAAQMPLQPVVAVAAPMEIAGPAVVGTEVSNAQPGHHVGNIAPEKTRLGTPVVAAHATV